MQKWSLVPCAVGFEATAGCFARGTWVPLHLLFRPPQHARAS